MTPRRGSVPDVSPCAAERPTTQLVFAIDQPQRRNLGRAEARLEPAGGPAAETAEIQLHRRRHPAGAGLHPRHHVEARDRGGEIIAVGVHHHDADRYIEGFGFRRGHHQRHFFHLPRRQQPGRFVVGDAGGQAHAERQVVDGDEAVVQIDRPARQSQQLDRNHHRRRPGADGFRAADERFWQFYLSCRRRWHARIPTSHDAKRPEGFPPVN